MTYKEFLYDSFIYRFTNKHSKRVYIGSTTVGVDRYNLHIKGKGSRLLKDAFKKYSIEDFEFEVMEYIDNTLFPTKEDLGIYLFGREQIYLDMYFAQEYIITGGNDRRFRELTYNLNPSSKGARGHKWSEESKNKLKAVWEREGHPCVGRKLSEETKSKIGNSHKEAGRYKGDKNPNYGIKSTKEKRDKCVKTWEESGNIYTFYSIDKDLNISEPLSNIKEYCKNHSYNSRGIYLCLQNRMRTYKGLAFCKASDLDNKIEEIKNTPEYWKGKKFQVKKGTCTIVVKNIITGEIKSFNSLLQACDFIQCKHTSITKALENNRSNIKDCMILSYQKLNKAA